MRRVQKRATSRSKDFKDDRSEASKYVFRLLGARDRSEKDLFDKLVARGHSEEVARETISYFREKRFVDDRRYAAFLKRDAGRKFLSALGTRYYMLKKGIPDEIVGEVLQESGDYDEIALQFARKKMALMKDRDRETMRNKLWGLLSRRGFSYDIIRNVMKSLDFKEAENEF